jgi:urease accessory protein
MGWHGRLQLRYERRDTHTLAHDSHEGPLRVLQRLHPEGPAVCHHVLVHAPGGIVEGDRLDVDIDMRAGAHALITTPGATRFYRSAGDEAHQCVQARCAADSRLEWLPLETIAYSGCRGRNRMRFDLQPGAQMIGWDVLALGLPASNRPFDRGSFLQDIEVTGAWIERGLIDAQDHALLGSPLGLAGRHALATVWFSSGDAIATALREALVERGRAIAAGSDLAATSGCTSPSARTVVLRCLAARVEPAMHVLRQVWAAWRQQAWQLAATTPRVWQT